jgi:membrane protein required for colicin V production
MSIGPYIFTGFDVVVLLICLVSLLMAASRGFARELVSLFALVFAGAIALIIFGRFRFAAQDFIQPGWLADGALGFGAFSLAFLLIVFLLSGVVKSLKGKDIGLVDRLMGAGFGVFRGLIIASLFVMVTTASYRDAQEKQAFQQSLTAEQRAAFENAPKSVREMLEVKDVELPFFLKDSTFYPLLNKIGDGIRLLPFTRIKSIAERLKDGDIPDVNAFKINE